MFLQHSDELKVVVNISAPTLQEAYSVKVDLDNHDDTLLLQVVSPLVLVHPQGARCSSAVRAFAHGAMGRRIDPS